MGLSRFEIEAPDMSILKGVDGIKWSRDDCLFLRGLLRSGLKVEVMRAARCAEDQGVMVL